MQDVLPPTTTSPRSIQNIPVPAGRRQFIPVPNEYIPQGSSGKHRGSSFWLWSAAVIVACVLAGMFVSSIFSGASVTVFPRQMNVSTPTTLQAALNAPAGSLGYQLMSVSQTSKRTVAASGQKQVSTTAQGTLTIFNTYSTATQKLIANTRFAAPDGKIYRIHAAVTVPGATKNADGSLKAGSIQTTAYADAAGADYNRGQTQFTIPGFQSDPRYTKFYATTDGISGGMVGIQPSVAPADAQNAQSQMQQELAQGLPTALTPQVPQGFTAVGGTLSIVYGTPSTADAGGGNATITEAATATEAIINTSDLASAVAAAQVQGYAGEAVNFVDTSHLSLAMATSTQYSAQTTLLNVTLSGTAALLWQFDPSKIQMALAGKNKSDFESIIRTFAPAVAKATASVKPFWKTTFPTNSTQIQVQTSLGN